MEKIKHRYSSEVHATDDGGYTALHCCVCDINEPVLDNGDTVRVLLEAGADVDAKTTGDGNCATPLHYAVNRRIAPIGAIRALLEGGANVNARDVFDQTPLHVACARSSVNGVEFLLHWGADEKLTDLDGETPAGAIVDSEEETPPDVTDAPGENRGKDEAIEADQHRIRQMLARAPADRSWHRRRWLVLSRSCPTKVQISNTSSSSNISSGSSGDGLSAEMVSVNCKDLGGDDKETEDQKTVNWRDLVVRLVGLEADVLFRLVVGFL
ncbi:unnamed protein product [Ectocarpus sp. CCAP 1310/34]|nr:unnamed protein product [Ectocarpus sp. CCAP 1310/34]